MAIRLRQIASDERSLLEVAKRTESRRVLWRRVRFMVVVLFLAAAAALVVHLRWYRLSGAVLVAANQDLLTSPGEATVAWLAPKSAGSAVKAGEPLARLRLRPGNQLLRQAELDDRRLERQRAALTTAQAAAALEHDRKNLAQEADELDAAAAAAAAELGRAAAAAAAAETVRAARAKELANARRLLLLDALTESDLLATERLFAVAKADHRRAVLREQGCRAELDGVRLVRERLRASRDEKLAAREQALAAASRLLALLDAELAAREEELAGRGRELVLAAPSDGLLLQPYCAVGQELRRGQPVVATFQPESVRLMAYLPERFRGKVVPGQTARVRIDRIVATATVLDILPAPVPVPAELRRRGLLPLRTYCIAIALDPAPDAPPFLPGQTGRAVFP